MSIHEQLSEFARRHSGEFIVINFATNDKGITPPVLRGNISKGLVRPEDGSYYTSTQVFPRAGTAYSHIMTSADGTNAD